METSRTLVTLLLLVLSAGCASTGAPAPARESALDQQVLSIDPNMVTGQLDNGLRYVIRSNQKPENRIELWSSGRT